MRKTFLPKAGIIFRCMYIGWGRRKKGKGGRRERRRRRREEEEEEEWRATTKIKKS